MAKKVIAKKIESPTKPDTRSKSIPKKTAAKESPTETRASRSKKAAPKKTRLSKSVDQPAMDSESDQPKDSVATVVFKEGNFVAYIDRSTIAEGKTQISIGKVSLPLSFTDQQMLTNLFEFRLLKILSPKIKS